MQRNTKEWIQYGSAIAVLLLAIILVYISYFTSQARDVTDNVLWYFAQSLMYAGSIFGVAIAIDAKFDNIKNKLFNHNNPGYHYVIAPNGGIHQLLAIEKVSNGVQGYNSTAINVAYIGGIDAKGKAIDNRTPEQKDALVLLLHKLKQQFPDAQIMGHRDIWGKDKSKWKKMCPCFNAIDEYKDIA